MKKFTLLATSMLLFATTSTLLAACSCKHEWKEATCVESKTCTLCNATEGEPLGHTVITDRSVDATCTADGLTAGEHCGVCNEVLVQQETIEALGHNWNEATCTEPKTCLICSETEGEPLGHIKGNWKKAEKGSKKLYCTICNEVLDSKVGLVENIYTASDIPNELMNDKFKNIVDLFSKGFSKSGLNIANATTYNDGETYIFYLDNLEFLGDECDDDPRIIYSGDAIRNNGTPSKIYFGFYNPLKSNGYMETVEMVEDIAEALDISDSGLIDNDYSSSSPWATGEYATFTFTNLGLKFTVSNSDAKVEIEIVPSEQ